MNLGNLLKDFSLTESLKIIKAAGFDGVDFSLWYYSAGNEAYLDQDNWRTWAQETRKLLDEIGLTVPQAHAYWRHPYHLKEDFSYELPCEIFHRNIEACRILGCDRLVFHSIQHYFPLKDVEATRRKVIDANIAWFSALIPTAEKFGVELHLENLFDYQHIQSPDAPTMPMFFAEDILEVLDAIHHPLMKTCLDTGHASIAGDDPARMIRLYGDKLGSLHLQDNFGKIYPIYEDIHLFPGTGRIKWDEVFGALKEVGYDRPLNMEISAGLPGKPKELQLLRLQQGRELMLKLADIYTNA